ncbi:MAG: pyrroline-5-carboxylate reductase [Gammaproteobacteria bacterium]|nr:pyrroline-5-carboxylate reductase [Gammaproteobacteria bacterium]
MTSTKITILGAGNMGTALLGGLIANDFPAKDICISDPDTEKLSTLKNQYHIQTAENNLEACQAANVILFAVKPQMMASIAKPLASIIQKNKSLVLSIAAGIRIQNMQNWLGEATPIVRCMPNTPALLRAGVTALFANAHVNATQKALADDILRAVGLTVWLSDEKLLDAVTALSGSGPAYFFLMMDALQQTGIQLGLPPETAKLLTVQTALGAARMAIETNVPLDELKRRVTSKGGTTEAALHVLEHGKLSELFREALFAAEKRSNELASSDEG